jgi:hypothetical protein
VPQTPVTADIHKPFNIQGDFGAQPAFDFIVVFNELPQPIQFLLGQIVDQPQGIDLRRGADFIGAGPANPKDIGQSNVYMFIGEIDPRYTCHTLS